MKTCVFVLSCFKHKNVHVSMYFLHLVPTFIPHYNIMDLLSKINYWCGSTGLVSPMVFKSVCSLLFS